MASYANPIPSILRWIASAVCLTAILLLTTPCAMAQQSPAPTAMHCADCCDGNPTLTTPHLCCALNPQPVQPSTVTSASPILRTVKTLLALSPSSPHQRTILIFAPTSRPPLHPILRI